MQTSLITLGEARVLRSLYLPDSLVIDRWDRGSRHYGVRIGNQICAVARVTRPDEGSLPFVEESKQLFEVLPNSVELGRVFIVPPLRRMWMLANLCHYIVEDLTTRGDKLIYVDSITEGGVKHRTLMRLGFRPVGVRYFDERYKSTSVVFAAPLEKLAALYSRKTAHPP